MKILLVDYKGKYAVAVDEDCIDALDFPVGEITKNKLIEESEERINDCDYYGIPAYVGNDPELNKIFNRPHKE